MTVQLSNIVAGCMRWGTWGANFSTPQLQSMIEQCLQQGVTTFDHADIYGHYSTETAFGKAFKQSSLHRNQIQIITKCGINLVSENRPQHTIKSYDCSAKHIIQSVEQSLINFQTDYIDVLLLHRPDVLLNPTEVAEAVSQLQQQGKVLSFGVSNFQTHQIELLQKHIAINYHQFELSVTHLQPLTNGTLSYCMQHNIVPLAWSPLGSNQLFEGNDDNTKHIISTVETLAKKYNASTNQILIAFLLKHPAHIIPVVGTTKMERLIQIKNSIHINLEKEDWYWLYQSSLGKEVD